MNQEIQTGASKVAVVIVNYNGGAHIINCLNALQLQTVLPRRVLVVDNASSDQSLENIKHQFPWVEIWSQADNVGFAAANNIAFDQLDGEDWVVLLNPDTLPNETWLEALLKAVINSPETDAFTSQLLDAADNNIIDGSGDIYHVCGLSWRRHHGLELDQEKLNHDPVFSPCGAAAMLRLERVRQVGGFDADYFCYNEDVDLMFRMRLSGCDCKFVEDSVLSHVGSALTGKGSDFSIYHGHRNLVWTYIKNMPGWYFWWYLPQHLALNLISLMYYTAIGRGRVIFRAKWHALLDIPSVLRKRKTVQLNRCIKSEQVIDVMSKGLLRPYLSRFR